MSKQVALSLFFSVYHVFRYICGFILCILGTSVIQICFQILQTWKHRWVYTGVKLAFVIFH